MARKWEEMTLKERTMGLGVMAFVVIIVIVIIAGGGGKEKQTTAQPSPTVSQQTQQPTVQEQRKTFVFDVPSLTGKNLDEVKAALSAYQKKTLEPTKEQIRLGVKEWEVEFEKDGKSLLVTYEIATRKIKDFFISTDDPSGKTQDKKHLLELGNLKEDDPKYKVEFVKVFKEPDYFTGVKVVPK